MSDVAYVICALDDIQSQRAQGFDLAVLDEAGEEKNFPIVVVRWGKQVFGYVNSCPHHGARLDWEREQFLDPTGLRLMCGKHGALFELGTGRCSAGPCKNDHLKPVELQVIDGDICITGVSLAEEEDEDEDEADASSVEA
ncbi:Rieske 2Fe-2S domain-containing protein [Rhodoblastus acidophilus]|uniref:Rieske 2Fe-2S domain-containing protein n=1 Tax=Candidatus Rhodoblastus alkanivorans TaxID=2954117 RepID=A0ABS9Z9T9_9HYPH|nr:Rieske 2Fe-2S domain-containing protein [Candidatus Rhodoblastus alkanivorans]MCI4677106.1 Rieske 2Fe-2S domain-containing protein [Candidatus Rhodoblastus alkanivorans]MCI4684459.1 Rieske 2Fe-2S domain-containing protein [Candidatus Rhodoblastus alkanivorans]MDI4641780.1 Rieske 2Fe-2S domain-containing protein [Rhodoblastus acidophilus]